jgi:RNA polymerase sigma factor (sigma-70 family)
VSAPALKKKGASSAPPGLALFYHLVEFSAAVRATLYQGFRNRADVDELYQDVAERLLVSDVDFNTIKSIRAYILTIARNVMLDELRHRKIVRIDYVADIDVLEQMGPRDYGGEELVNFEQELRVLWQAASLLAPICRVVFLMRKVYGSSQKEIAARLKISENTVEQHLTKAMRQIRPYLSGVPDLVEVTLSGAPERAEETPALPEEDLE